MSNNVIEIMGREGDTKHYWDSANPAEVAEAKKTFDSLKARGFQVFGMKGADKRGVAMNKFDPDAERLIAVPQIAGG